MNYYPRTYFVPVVVKNRDYLIGYLNALDNFTIGQSKIDVVLTQSSAKFNDILPGGLRRRNIPLEKQIQVMIDYRMNMSVLENPEAEEEFKDDAFFEVNCECGNYVSFKTAEEIPTHSFVCELCGKHMIDYTNRNDSDFMYDGDKENHLDFMEVVEMLFGEDDDFDEEDDGDDEE